MIKRFPWHWFTMFFLLAIYFPYPGTRTEIVASAIPGWQTRPFILDELFLKAWTWSLIVFGWFCFLIIVYFFLYKKQLVPSGYIIISHLILSLPALLWLRFFQYLFKMQFQDHLTEEKLINFIPVFNIILLLFVAAQILLAGFIIFEIIKSVRIKHHGANDISDTKNTL